MGLGELIAFFALMFAVFAALCAPIFGGVYIANSASCSATASKMGMESSFGLLTDCMVKIDGRWEPLSWQRPTRIRD